MRKTCPIVLPEQNSPKNAQRHPMRNASITRTSSSAAANRLMLSNVNSTNQLCRPNCNENNENYCFNETMSSSSSTSSSLTNTCLFQSNSSSNNQISELQNDHVVLSNDNTNQLPELSSLNNEFLNTILTTPNYQQSNLNSSTNIQSLSQHETNFVHDIDEESVRITTAPVTAVAVSSASSAALLDESRPRQLGRRSEMRSRIVSITAERNAEGNQVNTLSDLVRKLI